jgi:hypothetical protein
MAMNEESRLQNE